MTTNFQTDKRPSPLDGLMKVQNMPRPAGPVFGPGRQQTRGRGFEMFSSRGSGGMMKGMEQGGLSKLRNPGMGKLGKF